MGHNEANRERHWRCISGNSGCCYCCCRCCCCWFCCCWFCCRAFPAPARVAGTRKHKLGRALCCRPSVQVAAGQAAQCVAKRCDGTQRSQHYASYLQQYAASSLNSGQENSSREVNNTKREPVWANLHLHIHIHKACFAKSTGAEN